MPDAFCVGAIISNALGYVLREYKIFQCFGVGYLLVCYWFFYIYFEPLIRKEGLDIVEVLLGLLAIAGIYLIFNFYPEYKTGIIFGILSALLALSFPILNKKYSKFSPKMVTLYEMTGGCIALCFYSSCIFQFFPANYFFPTATDWMWLLVLAWICTVLSFYTIIKCV